MLRSWSRFRHAFDVLPIGPYYAISSAVIAAFLIVKGPAAATYWPIIRAMNFNAALISLLLTFASAFFWVIVRIFGAFLMPALIRDNRSQQEFLEKEEKICSDKSIWAERCADLTMQWNNSDQMRIWATILVVGGFGIWLVLFLAGVALFGGSLFGFDLCHSLQSLVQ